MVELRQGDMVKINRGRKPVITIDKAITPTCFSGHDNMNTPYIFSYTEICQTSLGHIKDIRFSESYMQNAARMSFD